MQALAEEQEVIEVLSNCVIEATHGERSAPDLKKIAGSAVDGGKWEIDAAKSFFTMLPTASSRSAAEP